MPILTRYEADVIADAITAHYAGPTEAEVSEWANGFTDAEVSPVASGYEAASSFAGDLLSAMRRERGLA
jgi:hypothetical protein